MKEFLAPFGRLRFWPAAGCVAAALLFWSMARLSGIDPALWQLLLLALAALASGAIVSSMRADTEAPPDLVVHTVNTPTWRPFIQVNRWEDRFIFAETKPGQFETSAAKRDLVELVDERLRLRRGLSLTDHPDQCRAVLGERTYAFLTRPVADCPTDWQLDQYLRNIEEI
ncbi:hypothetical protein [Glycomyces xiaoerkulensis]|uniref:hypothetical protein n=1 Tax=Glycomyces xiaoerkulensis TaxID=2038139 RepID=UPI000C256546|nr:hypothetical protein [Glycomyces xiaoerkulensis]